MVVTVVSDRSVSRGSTFVPVMPASSRLQGAGDRRDRQVIAHRACLAVRRSRYSLRVMGPGDQRRGAGRGVGVAALTSIRPMVTSTEEIS